MRGLFCPVFEKGGSVASWLKNKISIFAVLVILFACIHPAFSEEPSYPAPLDTYYSTYPSVTLTQDPARNELIKKGEYLSKMGDCIACHTHVEGNTPAYAGGLPINTPFGVFYSPNITPDKETGIGNWTEEDFFRAMRDGRDPHGRNYFPVFPFVYFAKTNDEDLKALYAYFMSIPAVKQENKPLPFPFSIPGGRLPLWGWKLLFFFPDNAPIEYDKTKSEEWNRGRYIVDGLGHCSMCHTPLNVFGSPKQRYYLTGGFIDGYWSPNITKNGLRDATVEDVVNVFAKDQLINNAGPVAGPMKEVNHDSLQYLTEQDQKAIAVYLKTVESEEPNGLKPSNEPPSAARGKMVYYAACDLCHQDGEMAAPIIGNSHSWYLRLQENGINGLYRHAINGFNSMPPRGACVTCSDNDIMSAVDFVLNKSLSRTQWDDLKNGGSKRYPVNGKNIYNENCAGCHTEGVNGAPKLGDKAAWNAIADNKNMDILILDILKGKNHPAQGGCKHCTTGDVLEAVKYIYKNSQVEGNYTLW